MYLEEVLPLIVFFVGLIVFAVMVARNASTAGAGATVTTVEDDSMFNDDDDERMPLDPLRLVNVGIDDD